MMISNGFLVNLSQTERNRAACHIKQVSLHRGEHLYNTGEHIRYVYFPEGAVLSMFLHSLGERSLETAMIGSEGASGLPSVLGDGLASHEVEVQHPGAAWRMEAAVFRDLVLDSGEFQRYALRYIQFLFVMAAQSAFCAANHPIEQRLARWLLMSQDGTGSESLQLTHKYLSSMLGVQRSSVTTAAQTLREMGCIGYSRGRILVTDRAHLETCACPCYAIIRSHQATLLSRPGI